MRLVVAALAGLLAACDTGYDSVCVKRAPSHVEKYSECTDRTYVHLFKSQRGRCNEWTQRERTVVGECLVTERRRALAAKGGGK